MKKDKELEQLKKQLKIKVKEDIKKGIESAKPNCRCGYCELVNQIRKIEFFENTTA